MNITIYYLSKKIIVEEKKQGFKKKIFKNLDSLSGEELLSDFKLFINQYDTDTCYFETANLKMGLEKFQQAFKLIEAAGGLIEHNGRYLFIYRLKKWDLPKGKLDKNESSEAAAVRECEEECGISKLSIIKTLNPTYHLYDYKGNYAIKKTFWYAMNTQHQGVLTPQTEENIEQVRWFNQEEIKQYVVPNTYPAILDMITNTILLESSLKKPS